MKLLKALFGASKDKAAETGINALANMAPDLMSEAGIREVEMNLDAATKSYVEAKADYDKEQREADEVQKLYDQRMQAAENINGQLEAAVADGDTAKAAKLEESLTTILTTIEESADDLAREIQEAADAKVWVTEAEAVMNEISEDLKGARKDLEAAKRDQATAAKQEERAKRMESRAKELAGIKKGSSGMSVASAAMRKNAEESKKRATAAEMKAKLLAPSKKEAEDDTIAQAMAAASGSPAAGGSLTDRLAALKKG